MENKKNKANQREALFFKDGDPNFTGVAVSVNQRKYQSIEKLLEELNEKVHLPNGVRNIMTPNGNHQVKWLHEIDDGKKYVCSSSSKIKKIDYSNIQKKPRFRIPRPPSSRVYEPFRKKNPPLFSERRQFKSLTIISKNDSNNCANIILTNRVKNIDTLFEEIGEKLGGKVIALTTVEGKLISLLSELFKNGDCFYAEIGDVSHEKPSSVPVSFYKNHNLKLNGSSPKPMTSSSAKLDRQLGSSNVTKKNKISPRKKDTSWLLTIKTSDIDDATSDNFAYIVLYGKHGKTNEYSLGVPEHAKGYYRDSISEVEIKTADIGDLYKIRIGHDDNGVAHGWHVDTILLTNLDTMKEYLFKCNRWFSREKDDGEIMREIPLYKNGKPVLPLIEYEVIVYTGSYDDSNTNFDIFVVIEGEKGDTGKRYLEASLSNAFRSKSIDTFSMEAVYLGQIKDVVITAEAVAVDEELAWFAEKVIVRDTVSGIEYSFPLTSDEKAKAESFLNNSIAPTQPKEKQQKQTNYKLQQEQPNYSFSPSLPSNDEKCSDVFSKNSNTSSPQLTSNSIEEERPFQSNYPVSSSPVSSTVTNKPDSEETFDQSESSFYSNSSDAILRENRHEIADDELPDESSMNEGIQVVAFSKVTGRALCFNSASQKVHAFGQENFCCIWTVLDGNTEESVLLYSLQGDGYLAVDQSGVVLTKGGPGAINEFYVIISESSEAKEVSLESVIHSGIFLCSDNYGYVFGSEGQSEATKFLLTHKAYDVNQYSIEESGCPHFIMPVLSQAQNDVVKKIKTQEVDSEIIKIDIENKEKKKRKKDKKNNEVTSPILLEEVNKVEEKIQEEIIEVKMGQNVESHKHSKDKTKNKKINKTTQINREAKKEDKENESPTIETEVKNEKKKEMQENEVRHLGEVAEIIEEKKNETSNNLATNKTKKKYRFKKKKKSLKVNVEIENKVHEMQNYQFDSKKDDNNEEYCNMPSNTFSGNESDVIEMRLDTEDTLSSSNNVNLSDEDLKQEKSLDNNLMLNDEEENKEEEYFVVLRAESACKMLIESEENQIISDRSLRSEKINNLNIQDLPNESNAYSKMYINKERSHSFDEGNSFDEGSIYKNSTAEDDYASDNFEGDDESDDCFKWEEDGKSHRFDTTQISQSRPHSMTQNHTLDRPIITRTNSLPNKYTPLLPIKPNDFLQQNESVVENQSASSEKPVSSIFCETDFLNKEVPTNVYINAGDCEVDASMQNFSSRSEKSQSHTEIEGLLITSSANTKNWNYADDESLNNPEKLHHNESPLENNHLLSSTLVEDQIPASPPASPSRPDSCITMNVTSSPLPDEYSFNLFD